MLIIPNATLKKWLVKDGKRALCLGMYVNKSAYEEFLAQAAILHPEYSIEEAEAWAGYTAFTHPSVDKPLMLVPEQRKKLIALAVWAVLSTLTNFVLGWILYRG